MSDKIQTTEHDNISVKDSIPLAEEMVSSLIATIRKQQMYPENHVAVKETMSKLHGIIKELHHLKGSFVIGVIDGEVIFEDVRLKRLGESIYDTLKSLNDLNIDSLSFDEGVSLDGLSKFTSFLSNIDQIPKDNVNISEVLKHHGISHIKLGKSGKRSSSPEHKDTKNECNEVYESTRTVLYSIFESIRSKNVFDMDSADSLSENIIEIIQSEKDTLTVMMSLNQSDDHTFTHSLNVSILNVLQCMNLSFDSKTLKRASTAGLLHDIGKRSLPEEILNKTKSLTKEEEKIYRTHPIEGAKILLTMPDTDPASALVAYEHHQRYDLKGYPPVRDKKRLNPLSLITAISDMYDNLRNPLSRGFQVLCYQAMAYMKKYSGTAFDPFLLECFEKLIGYYPPGTCVELDTEETALVVKACKDDAARPSVRIVKSTPSSPPKKGEIVSLREMDNQGRFLREIKKLVPPSVIDGEVEFYME